MSDTKILLIAGMAETFRQNLTEPALALYVDGLSELSDAQVQHSIRLAIRRCKWFPNCAELRDIAGAGVCAIRQQAEVDFANLGRALIDGTSKHLNEQTKRAMNQLGGFNYLFKLPEEQFQRFTRSQFLTLYEANTKQLPALQGPGQQDQKCIGSDGQSGATLQPTRGIGPMGAPPRSGPFQPV